jgi:hypothetical protein
VTSIAFAGIAAESGQTVPFQISWVEETRCWQVRLAHLTVPALPAGLREFAQSALVEPQDGLETDSVDFASDGATTLGGYFSFHDDKIELSALAVFDYGRGFHAVSQYGEPLYGADGTTGPYLQFYGEDLDRAVFTARARELLALLDAHPDAETYQEPVLKAEFAPESDYNNTRLRISTADDQWWLRLSGVPSIVKPLPVERVRELGRILRSGGQMTLLAELNYRLVATVEGGQLALRVSSQGEDGEEYVIDLKLGPAKLNELP